MLIVSACNLPGRTPPNEQPFLANIFSMSGSGFAHQPGQEDWLPLAVGIELSSGGQVFSGPQSQVRIDLPDGSQIHLGADTLITIQLLAPDLATITLVEGQFWIIPAAGRIQIDTPFGIGFEQGAYMSASYLPTQELVTFGCLQGICQVGNDSGSLALEARQSAWLGPDPNSPPQLNSMNQAEVQAWSTVYPAALSNPDQPSPTSETFSLLSGTATQIALTQSVFLTATASALAGATPLPTSEFSTTLPTTSNKTSFSNVIGPPSGTISNCVFSYYVDAVDPDGVSYVKVEHSLSPNFTNSISIKLTNVWGDTWAEPRVFDTTANPGADKVYWRFWALDFTGDITYFPDSPFSYNDTLNCGGPVKFTNVIGPTSGQIAKCLNYYSVDAIDNTEQIFSVKIEYAFNPSMVNSQWLSMSKSGNTWFNDHLIETQSNPGPDTVYWRFWARTFNHGNNIFYNPASGTYSYVDTLDCGGPTQTPTMIPSMTSSPTLTLTPAPSSPTPTIALSLSPSLPPTSTPSPAPTDTPTITSTTISTAIP